MSRPYRLSRKRLNTLEYLSGSDDEEIQINKKAKVVNISSIVVATSVSAKFDNQTIVKVDQNYKVKQLERDRLDSVEYNSESNDDDSVQTVKESKVVAKAPAVVSKPPLVNFARDVWSFYQTKQYEKCLSMIDEFFNQPLTDKTNVTRFRIIQAASWTMLSINKEKVLSTLQQIIAVDSKNSFAFYALGLAQYRNGDFNDCVGSFESAVDLNPTPAMQTAMVYKANALALMDLINNANLQFELNNCYRAFEVLNAAFIIDPDNEKITEMIHRIRKFFANDLIERLKQDIESEIPELFDEAEKLINLFELVRAEKLLTKICNGKQETSQTVYLKGLLAYMKGGLIEAQTLFKTALSLNESNEKAKKMSLKAKTLKTLLDRATAEMQDKDNIEAVKTLTEALAVDVNNRVINQAAHLQRGMAYFSLGQIDKSREDYNMFEMLKQVVGNVLNTSMATDKTKEPSKAQSKIEQEAPIKDDNSAALKTESI